MSDVRPTQAFTFVDLFAGIGGIRIAMESAGGTCVMTSEWDRWARKTYEAFFGEEEHFIGDINDIAPADVPDHDVLCGGFPCQPFSLAGVSKKNSLGRAHGFDDPTQGTLFFRIKEILRAKQPGAFLLENVRHLQRHDRGRTWTVISNALTDCGYSWTARVIDASSVVPQHRERVFIAGLRNDLVPRAPLETLDWSKFWSQVDDSLTAESENQRRRYALAADHGWPMLGPILQTPEAVESRYVLTDRLWEYLQAYRRKHEAKGNGFGYGLVEDSDARTRTLSARYYKDGSEILVSRGQGRNPRRLTPLECLRLQGFPAELEAWFDGSRPQPVSDTQAYRQFGNSVAVPVVTAIASVLARYLGDVEARTQLLVPERAGFQTTLALPESNDAAE
jgi:DNA (cytosine-5)-methyltransferase 1